MESTEPQLSPIFAQFNGGQYSRSSGFGVNTEILGDHLSEHSSANFISSATFISRLVWFGMTWVQNVLLLTSWSLSLVLALSEISVFHHFLGQTRRHFLDLAKFCTDSACVAFQNRDTARKLKAAVKILTKIVIKLVGKRESFARAPRQLNQSV